MSKKRVGYFDALNVVSCIAVVTMHVNGTSLYTFHHSVSWLSSLFIDCLCYFAVPVFFMLTGATLMDYRKRYNTYEFIKKRFSRTMIPFLFWSVVAIVWCVLALKCLKWSDVSSPIKLINVIFNHKHNIVKIDCIYVFIFCKKEKASYEAFSNVHVIMSNRQYANALLCVIHYT